MMTRNLKVSLIGFVIGALVPLLWGVLSFLLFNVREGWFSRAYWHALYIRCPFWVIDGEKDLFLMPLLNGCLYALIASLLMKILGGARRCAGERRIRKLGGS
jgi:hypothetical protein